LGQVGRRLFEREMAVERSRWKKGQKLPPLFSARPGEEEDVQCHSKRHRFLSFFFNEQWMKRCRFGQNASFHLKKRAAKTCQSPNQSSICDLFNQVLSCNFDFKYQFNCILAKFNPQP
jgi:hypothetical protein